MCDCHDGFRFRLHSAISTKFTNTVDLQWSASFRCFFLLPPSLLKIFGWAMLTLCCRVYWHLLVALRRVWRVFHFARLVVSLDILAIRTSLEKSVTCSKEFWSNVVILSFAVFLMKTNCTVCCQKTVSCFLLVVKAFINFQLFLN